MSNIDDLNEENLMQFLFNDTKRNSNKDVKEMDYDKLLKKSLLENDVYCKKDESNEGRLDSISDFVDKLLQDFSEQNESFDSNLPNVMSNISEILDKMQSEDSSKQSVTFDEEDFGSMIDDVVKILSDIDECDKLINQGKSTNEELKEKEFLNSIHGKAFINESDPEVIKSIMDQAKEILAEKYEQPLNTELKENKKVSLNTLFCGKEFVGELDSETLKSVTDQLKEHVDEDIESRKEFITSLLKDKINDLTSEDDENDPEWEIKASPLLNRGGYGYNPLNKETVKLEGNSNENMEVMGKDGNANTINLANGPQWLSHGLNGSENSSFQFLHEAHKLNLLQDSLEDTESDLHWVSDQFKFFSKRNQSITISYIVMNRLVKNELNYGKGTYIQYGNRTILVKLSDLHDEVIFIDMSMSKNPLLFCDKWLTIHLLDDSQIDKALTRKDVKYLNPSSKKLEKIKRDYRFSFLSSENKKSRDFQLLSIWEPEFR